MSIRNWRYAAETPSGVVATGVIPAAGVEEAIAKLRTQSLRPLRVERERRIALSDVRGDKRLTEPLLARMCRRLAGLLGAGLPLIAALRIGTEQATHASEKRYFSYLHERIRAGASVTEAVGAGAETPRLFQALISAGESLGDLGGQLQRLAVHYEARVALRRELVAQLIYPAALVIMIVATFYFLSFFVLPQFEQVFSTAGTAPPPETRAVLALGAFLRAWWWTSPLALLVAGLTLQFLAHRHAARLARWSLEIPVLGRHLAETELARFFRTLSTLLQGGMALSRALPIARETLGHQTLRAGLSAMETRVRGGERFGRALRAIKYIPSDLVSFIEIGDETGALGQMAAEAASTAETRIRERLKRSMALLAPALTAVMGLVTAGVIGAVMSGVLSLNDAVGR